MSDRAQTLGLGAGVQSSALLLMCAAGEVDFMPEVAVFSDVGGGTTQVEPAEVYRWVDFLRRTVGERIPVETTWSGDLYGDLVAAASGERGRVSHPPVLLRDPVTGSRGIARRGCTRDYKIRPVNRKLRELGYGPAKPVRHALAISFDEIERMARPEDMPKWIELAYPLVDARITRQDCVDWMREHGYPEPVRSACVFCPYHSDAYWRTMREQRPEEWAMAQEVDLLVRKLPGLDGEGYLHKQRVPLDQVVLAMEDLGQGTLFDREDGAGECGGGCFL